MSVILRVDDFPGTKPNEFKEHNLDNFKKFDNILEKYNVKEYVLGVIPKYTDEESLKWLTCNKRIKIALHGIEHDERYDNEFKLFEIEDDIFDKLCKAKLFLEKFGVRVTDYIPPHNVIDYRTVRALSRLGFKRVFGGPGTHQFMFFQNDIKFVYSEKNIWYGRSDELMGKYDVIDVIMKESKMSNQCLTLHWPWEWNIGLENLDKLLGKITNIF